MVHVDLLLFFFCYPCIKKASYIGNEGTPFLSFPVLLLLLLLLVVVVVVVVVVVLILLLLLLLLFPSRLASTFERRLKHRQVNVENISQLNSPSEVENDFRDFLDGERMEAWDIIENSLFSTHTIENDVKIRYLTCIIFVVSS